MDTLVSIIGHCFTQISWTKSHLMEKGLGGRMSKDRRGTVALRIGLWMLSSVAVHHDHLMMDYNVINVISCEDNHPCPPGYPIPTDYGVHWL